MCTKIHIEFNNLEFHFNRIEYYNFVDYFKNLDGSYWEDKNRNAPYLKKIIVPIDHTNIRILLSNEDLIELKELITIKKVKKEKFIFNIHPN